MRVLFVSRGFPPHGRWGTEAYTLQLARGLAREGHEISVFHPDVRDDGEAYALYDVESGPFRVTRVILPRVREKRLELSYQDPGIEAAFEKVLMRERPDVVHFTYLLWTLSVRMPTIAKRLGIACVLTATDFGLACHRGQYFDWRLRDCGGPHPPAVCARCIREPSRDEGDPVLMAGKRWLARSLALVGGAGRVVVRADVERREAAVKAALASIDEAIAPTADVKRMLLYLGVPAQRITSLCYAVDAEQFAIARARPAPSPPRIGYVGQFAPHKGPHVLLEAVEILERRLPESVEPWEVVLYGEGVEGRHRRYPSLLRASAVGPRVSIAAPFESVAVGEVLSGLSCVVVPSLWRENAPLSALEARAAGIPVIASNVPGLSEIIEHGVHGALFPAGNAAALADLLRAVILGRIAPRHAPSQPIGYAEHVARVAGLYRRALERSTVMQANAP
jgi:glycosyltransferase involved in cell wall biosynthesis